MEHGRDHGRRMAAHIALMGGALIYSGFNIVTKLCLSSGVSPIIFSFYREVGACFLLVPYAVMFESPLTLPSKKHLPRCLLLGLLLFSFQLCFVFGLKLTTPTTAALFQCLEPITAAAIGAALCMEACSLAKVAAAILAGAGVIVSQLDAIIEDDEGDDGTRQKGTPSYLLGCGLLVGQGVLISLYCLHQKVLVWVYGPVTVITYAYASSTLYMGIAALVDWQANVEDKGNNVWSLGTSWGLVALAYAVVLASFVGYSLRAWANKFVDASVLVLYNTVQPPITALLGALFLHESLTWNMGVGSLLIFAGLWIIVTDGRCIDALRRGRRYCEGVREDSALLSSAGNEGMGGSDYCRRGGNGDGMTSVVGGGGSLRSKPGDVGVERAGLPPRSKVLLDA